MIKIPAKMVDGILAPERKITESCVKAVICDGTHYILYFEGEEIPPKPTAPFVPEPEETDPAML